MDTITHGIAGALIGKAVFGGDEMFTLRPMNRGRVITGSLMLGAIFPDADVFREMVSHNPMLILTWHRSITHSLICLPIFALALAALTQWFARWRKWDPPSFVALAGIYAVGIASHILLDLVTSFGTMIWSPLKWSRPAWDLIFIIDFTLSAIFLVPQILAWIYGKPENLRQRALWAWLIFVFATFVVAGIAQRVGAPISVEAILYAVVIFAALFLLPSIRGFGLKIKRASWNLAGLVVALCYIAAAFYAHQAAFARVEKFVALEHLEAQAVGTLPLPPSIWHWDGLVRAPHGVYEMRIDFGDAPADAGLPPGTSAQALPIEYRFYPDAPDNSYIEAAKHLSQVQTVLWFARFPVIRFHKEGSDAIVEIADIRFPHVRPDQPASFTYQVRFGADGMVLSQGWEK
ncbi:MAG: metal-dependent hydrolase [Candidatus Acidiferrum sp.]